MSEDRISIEQFFHSKLAVGTVTAAEAIPKSNKLLKLTVELGGESRVLVRRYDGEVEPMEEASHFMRHLARIVRFRLYTPAELEREVAAAVQELWR